MQARMRRVVVSLIAITSIMASSPASHAGGTSFVGRNSVWHPHRLTVAQGTRVTWHAADITHTVTAYRGNWSKDTTISADETTGFTFHNAGRFKFRCTIHSDIVSGRCEGMCGKVIVT